MLNFIYINIHFNIYYYINMNISNLSNIDLILNIANIC